MRRSWVLFVVVWLAHAVLSAASLLVSFKLSSDHFEGHRACDVCGLIAQWVMNVTWFPIPRLVMEARLGIFSGLLGWLPVLLNSLLWAALLVFGIPWLWRKASGPQR